MKKTEFQLDEECKDIDKFLDSKPKHNGNICCEGCYRIGKQQARKEILDFIEKERDIGNFGEVGSISGKRDGFSAGICLSDLMRYLRGNNEI